VAEPLEDLVKLTVMVRADTLRKIEARAVLTDTSVTTELHRLVEFAQYLDQQVTAGGTVFIRRADGQFSEILNPC